MTTDIEFTPRQIKRRGRSRMIVIAVLFAAPIVLAWLVFASGWYPRSTTNHGELIQPPTAIAASDWVTRAGQPFNRADLLGYWNLALVVDHSCQQSCVGLLDLLRRLRIGLNANADRVHLLLLQPQGTPRSSLLPKVKHPVVFDLLAPSDQIAALLAQSADGAGAKQGVFIIDYRGFNMMTYPTPLDGSGMLDDVQHLLRVSNRQSEEARQQPQNP